MSREIHRLTLGQHLKRQLQPKKTSLGYRRANEIASSASENRVTRHSSPHLPHPLKTQTQNIVRPPPVLRLQSKFNSNQLYIIHHSYCLRARIIASDGQSSRSRLDDASQSPVDAAFEQMAVDPTKGGAVDPKTASAQLSKALEVLPGRWVWDGVIKVLEVDLFSPAWQVRHGAAMALRELLNVQGKCGGMKGRNVYFASLSVCLHPLTQAEYPPRKMKSTTKRGATILRPNFCVYSSWIVSEISFPIRCLSTSHRLWDARY